MTPDLDDLSAYDYDLPPERIAAEPAGQRDAARLLVVDRAAGTLAHHTVADLPALLRPGDRLVLNDTRVVPARLRGVRAATGGRWEGLFLRTTADGEWELLGKAGGRLQPGEAITVDARGTTADPLRLILTGRGEGGVWTARPDPPGDAFALLDRYGEIPLPPYIRKGVAGPRDVDRYQTVYARHAGSVAAPTAGLHFTPDLLAACEARGIGREFVTLHVGVGTFRPIAVERLADHVMHSERAELAAATADRLRATRSAGGRVVAVGTTTVRTLESAAAGGDLRPFRGETTLFIRPPYEFRAVDALLTNFHLPRSSLLVLVSAFAGGALIRRAYSEAIDAGYRFYSYGDAMLIV